MGYTRKLTMKIVRRKHEVTSNLGGRLEDLIDDLRRVPADAVLDLWNDPGEPTLVLVFHEERSEEVPDGAHD